MVIGLAVISAALLVTIVYLNGFLTRSGLKYPLIREPQTVETPPRLPQDTAISFSQQAEDRDKKNPTRLAILNAVQVEKYEVQSNSTDNLTANLQITFQLNGRRLSLSVPIIERIELQQLRNGKFLNSGPVMVNNIPLKTGQEINIAFLYVPTNVTPSLIDLEIYCSEIDFTCATYIPLGFGTITVDFNSYINELFSSTDYGEIELDKVIPASLLIL